MALIGSLPFTDRQWAPQLKISGMNAPAESWIVDPALPPLGTDPRYPTTDQIVIPRGRLLGVRADTTTYTGKAVLTLANGKDTKPCGYADTNILREFQEKLQWAPKAVRQEFIEVPYVSAINGAYGALAGGDRITAYYGSVTSATAVVPNHKGKIVKWVPKTLYSHKQAAGLTASLASANYPAFQPTVIMAWEGTTVLSSGASSWAFNGTNWVATFLSNVTDVLYSFGQNADQIHGEVIRIEPISASHHLHGWLEWVTDNFLAWEYPPQLIRVPTTTVSLEVPETVDSSLGWYRLANKPVAPWKTITVTVTGTLTAPDGSQTSLSGTALSVADVPMTDYTLGQYYNINSVTGDLYISNNISVTALTVDYSYETAYRDGRLFNSGIIGLTDGPYSGVAGTPANLEVSGVVGSLRCIIY